MARVSRKRSSFVDGTSANAFLLLVFVILSGLVSLLVVPYVLLQHRNALERARWREYSTLPVPAP